VGNKRKTVLCLAGLLALVLLAMLAPVRAHAANATGAGEATIVTPLSLVNTAPLSFGNIIPAATPSTVTIDAFTEGRTAAGGAILTGGTVSAAKFQGLTSPPSHLKIDIPTTPITLTRAGGGATMTVSNFELNGDKNDWVAANTLFEFQVGAQLNVGANQLPGAYSGTFTVTVNYR
jgi:hypothetical protein